ncbi:MAG: helix-turn-helix domain-containing protein [Deltaproteobacteria bacterium]|nr:helix-turn-helix domain-containing protein [Deltaproteobacteria bacterium]
MTGPEYLENLRLRAYVARVRLSDAFILAGLHPCNISRGKSGNTINPRKRHVRAVHKAIILLKSQKDKGADICLKNLKDYGATLGGTILALSRLRKMNESKLSQRLGLSVYQLQKIKRGKAPPDFRILAELAEVLDCPVASLLDLRIRDDLRRCGMNLDVHVRGAA